MTACTRLLLFSCTHSQGFYATLSFVCCSFMHSFNPHAVSVCEGVKGGGNIHYLSSDCSHPGGEEQMGKTSPREPVPETQVAHSPFPSPRVRC